MAHAKLKPESGREGVLMNTEENWVCVTPPRCPAKRRRTLGEFLFGWLFHFDAKHGTQCNHYMGHEFFEAISPDMAWHECPMKKRWK